LHARNKDEREREREEGSALLGFAKTLEDTYNSQVLAELGAIFFSWALHLCIQNTEYGSGTEKDS
jgi:hypothetical protein